MNVSVSRDNMTDVAAQAREEHPRYDFQGSMVYVVVVLLFYGFSILFFIASMIRKQRNTEYTVDDFMENMSVIRRAERKEEARNLVRVLKQRRLQAMLKTRDRFPSTYSISTASSCGTAVEDPFDPLLWSQDLRGLLKPPRERGKGQGRAPGSVLDVAYLSGGGTHLQRSVPSVVVTLMEETADFQQKLEPQPITMAKCNSEPSLHSNELQPV